MFGVYVRNAQEKILRSRTCNIEIIYSIAMYTSPTGKGFSGRALQQILSSMCFYIYRDLRGF